MGFVLILIALAGQVWAEGYVYSQGTAMVTKPVELRGTDGSSLTLNAGPVSLEVSTYGMFYGDGKIAISNAAGKVTFTIPRDTYKSGWVFFTPAPRLNGSYGLSGRNSQRVDQETPREDVAPCNVPATDLLVVEDNGRPLMWSANGRTAQLKIRLCSQTVNGNVEVRQIASTAAGCDGHQRVLKQIERTQEMFTLDILDPESGQSIGKIEAGAPDQAVSRDKIVRKLTACSR